MGLSISVRKLLRDAPLRIRESIAIENGVLKVWLAPFICPDGTIVFRSVTIHLDNWDKRFIHVLMAGMTVLDLPSKTVFVRNRLRDLSAHLLIKQTPEEAAAALLQLVWRAKAAQVESTDEVSEADVAGLVESERAHDELIAEEKKLRQSVKLGRKKNVYEEHVADVVVIASRDFDGGDPVKVLSGITFKAGDVLRLVQLLPAIASAVVQKGEGALRQVGYVPNRFKAGYDDGDDDSSIGHIHTPAKEMLARDKDRRRSLEDVANAPVERLEMDPVEHRSRALA